MGTQGEAAVEAAGLETTFMELSSLIPMAKNVSPLEEIAANSRHNWGSGGSETD